jgi:hypothetical protein
MDPTTEAKPAEETEEQKAAEPTAVVEQEEAVLAPETADPEPIFQKMEEMRRAVEEGKDAPPADAPQATKAVPAEAGKQDEEQTQTDAKEGEGTDELERLKRELRKRDGKYGSEKQQLTARIDALERQLQEAAARMAEAPAAKPASVLPTEKAEVADPTDEDLKAAYGDDFEDQIGRDFAARLWKSNQRLMQAHERQLIERMDGLAESKLAKAQAQKTLERAVREIEAVVPGASELDAKADTNGFAAYLDEEHGDTGFTRREVADRALASLRGGATGSDYERAKSSLVKLFKGFGGNGSETESTKERTAPKPRPDPRQYVMPSTSKADRNQAPAGTMTVDQAREAMRNAAASGDIDKVLSSVFKKAVKGEVVA